MTFGQLKPLDPDPVLALSGRYRADPRLQKMDLGVGVYRDADGTTPVFSAVKSAERLLVETQTTKSYLGPEGDLGFVGALLACACGSDLGPRLGGLQTVGGTGALRLAAELLARSRPGRRLWMGLPSWPNHRPLFAAAGLEVRGVDLYDASAQRFRPAALLEALEEAAPGDAVLLHGCCHNPTGVDPNAGFWEDFAGLAVRRGLLPLVDTAYQGLGDGWHADGAGLRRLAARAPNLLVAFSCNKNFGLYRERVGALFVAGETAAQTATVQSHLTALARTDYSMPPDHGAAVVRTILESPSLTQAWRAELETVRMRLRAVRTALSLHGRVGAIDLAALAPGRGMFAMLPLSAREIELLQSEHGIYMAPTGRINIAGLTEPHLERFVEALHSVQRRHAA